MTKRHLMAAAARNLSTIMRVICGISSPRALQGLCTLLQIAWTHIRELSSPLDRLWGRADEASKITNRLILAA